MSILGKGFIIGSFTWIIGLITVPGMSLIQVAGLILGSQAVLHFGTLGWVLLIYPVLPSIIYSLFFTRAWKGGGVVPGAADNLSACAVCLALCRLLANNPDYIPDNTEIRFITFGSEEAGYRGSRRYVACHLDELKRLDARLLNFETIVHPEIVVFSSDTNGAVKNSPEMVKSVVAAAQRAQVPYKVEPAYLGVGTDASPFSQVGLRALTLFPVKGPQQMVSFYHQKSDRPEVLSIEPLFNVMKLSLEWVRCGGE